jgi:hypothetical protein
MGARFIDFYKSAQDNPYNNYTPISIEVASYPEPVNLLRKPETPIFSFDPLTENDQLCLLLSDESYLGHVGGR